jgi:hypothetical protein
LRSWRRMRLERRRPRLQRRVFQRRQTSQVSDRASLFVLRTHAGGDACVPVASATHGMKSNPIRRSSNFKFETKGQNHGIHGIHGKSRTAKRTSPTHKRSDAIRPISRSPAPVPPVRRVLGRAC